MVRLQEVKIKKVEDESVWSTVKCDGLQKRGEKGEKECVSRLDRAAKNVRCDV